MTRRYRINHLISLALVCGSCAGVIQADVIPAPENPHAEETSSSLWGAFRQGDVHLRLRLRHEHVEAQDFSRDADATTLLTRLDYHTQTWETLQLFAQADAVFHLGPERFNDTRNGHTQYPLVPDPDGFLLNRLYLDWTGLPHTLLRGGRQCLDYDYVGCSGMAWRQHEPVYDAFKIVNTSVKDVTLTATYLSKMHTPFGPHAGTPPATLDMHSATLIAEYSGWTGNRLGLHFYHFDSVDLPTASTDSLGLRLDGNRSSGAWQWLYAARYFTQTNTGPNPNDYRAANYFVESGLSRSGWTIKLSRDVLEGDATAPNRNYTRPLNVVHFYLGWAEKFAPIPATGVEDTFLTVSGSLPLQMQASVIFHYFDSEASTRHYGEEWDALLTRSFGPHIQGLVKLADYRAGDAGPGPAGQDTRKFWLQLLLSY